MKERSISITQFDRQRLDDLLAVADEFDYRDRPDLKRLAEELDRGHLVDSKAIAPTVVTMNSRVCLRDLGTDEAMEYTLVFPKDADIEEGKISVMSPIGTAILGYSVGTIIDWEVPSGKRRIKIEALSYQPEAAGDYHL
ncbi:MAG: nucleoside diphosphate kinase regulator [Spartobacteria bacterium]|nr:nucleoside diphosphate kinase regulator [Spartobacteria bacterium]